MTKRAGIWFGLQAVLVAAALVGLILCWLGTSSRFYVTRFEAWRVQGGAEAEYPPSLVALSWRENEFTRRRNPVTYAIRFYKFAGPSNTDPPFPATRDVKHSDMLSSAPEFREFFTWKSISGGSLLGWNEGWGDPTKVVEEFATDRTVPRWTEEEFIKWIAAREGKAK